MPILVRVIYRDEEENVLNNVGPGIIYVPDPKKGKIKKRHMFKVLEDELEEYSWSGHDSINVEFEVISKYVF